MKRIDWIRQMPIEQAAIEILSRFDTSEYCHSKPECDDDDYITPEHCANCVVDWLNEETKTPAESEAQAGANKNITNDIVAQNENVVNMRTKEEIEAEIKRLEAERSASPANFRFAERLWALKWVLGEES